MKIRKKDFSKIEIERDSEIERLEKILEIKLKGNNYVNIDDLLNAVDELLQENECLKEEIFDLIHEDNEKITDPEFHYYGGKM